MSKVAHLIGNGDSHHLYKPAKGIIMTCNLPPITDLKNVYATAIVDFKMCRAMDKVLLICVLMIGLWEQDLKNIQK